MTRQTRVGLLLGLIFIVAFGIVLSELKGTGEDLIPVLRDEPLGELAENPTAQAPQDELVLGPVGGDDTDEPEHYARTPEPARQPAPRGEVTMHIVRRRPQPSNLHARIVRQEDPRDVAQPRREVSPQAVARRAPAEPVYDDAPNFDPMPTVTRDPVEEPAPAELAAPRRGPQPARTYRVQDDDTLFGIAERFYGPGKGHLYARIAEANDLRNARTLRPGQKLIIPPLNSLARAPRTDASPQPGPREMTIDQLAQHVGASDVLRENPDEPQLAAPASPGRRTYVVQSGDSLWKIAKHVYNDTSPHTIDRIYQANRDRMPDKDTVRVGMTLKLPG